MTDTIKIADSILYGRYQRHKDQAKKVFNLIDMAMPHARKLLDLPDNINFVIRPNGGKYNGSYNYKGRRVNIDPRRENLGTILSTICHELVHAEQYHTGRLSKSGIATSLWNGEAVKNKGTTYKAYRNQPWEIEAFDRQEDLAKQITAMIGDSVGGI